jgi:hypothetical protein
MENQKQLKKYTNAFIDALSPYLRKGFNVSATIHPASGEGAVIEFEIHEGRRSDITIVSAVPRVNDTLGEIPQSMIGGNIQGVTFRGTNLYMEGQRVVIIKGEDEHTLWSNRAASEDVGRVVSPKGSA